MDYFAPQILEEDFVDFEDGELLPDGPGYRALIIYQETLPVRTAEKLLAMAKKGLPILYVNGVNETIRPGGITKTHGKAAIRTPFYDGEDERLQHIVAEMKSLATYGRQSIRKTYTGSCRNWISDRSRNLQRAINIF